MKKLKKFIEKSKLKHNDKYNYDKVNYINSLTKVIITCPIHGDFEQIPSEHTRGYGCSKCGHDRTSSSQKISINKFIERSTSKHGEKYDYSLVNFNKVDDKVIIICSKHGKFEQQVNLHYNGHGCTKCANEASGLVRTSSKEEFIISSNIIHSNKYNYDKVNYINSKTKVIITCPIHGDFEQIPNSHLNGKGCSKCINIVSKAEIEILKIIKEIRPDLKITTSDRTIIKPKEIDIVIHDLKLGIEFNGLYWHSSDKKHKKYHQDKCLEMEKKGYNLISIFEDDWLLRKSIVINRLKNLLYRSDKIYARTLRIKEVNNADVKDFVNKYHIQGHVNSSYTVALYSGEDIKAVMSFSKKRYGKSKINSYELVRYVSEGTIVGGPSKLLKYFSQKYKPDEIISYADMNWSNGNLYKILGFTMSHITEPSYYYFNDVSKGRQSRYKFTKDKIVKFMKGDKNLTESENMKQFGYLKIYDCGNYCFIKKF